MPAINPQLVTTAFELPGHRTVRNFGVVRGIVVRSRSIVGNIGAALQTLVGGNITLYTELCERAREGRLSTDARARRGARGQRAHRRSLRRERSGGGRDGSAGVRYGSDGRSRSAVTRETGSAVGYRWLTPYWAAPRIAAIA